MVYGPSELELWRPSSLDAQEAIDFTVGDQDVSQGTAGANFAALYQATQACSADSEDFGSFFQFICTP